jgi:hypothetical protein
MSMPALSIRQPLAWAICAGHKDVENRAWNTRRRGRFAVQAGGRQPAPAAIQWIRDTIGLEVPADWQRGALIGVATLVDIIDVSDRPWAQPGQLHWFIADGRLWPEAILCRGQLGFFHPPELAAAPE